MAVRAYAVFPTTLDSGVELPVTSFEGGYRCVVGDGVKPTQSFSASFVYDATETPAINLANLKQDISNKSLLYGFTVPTANVIIFTGIQ